MIYSKNKNDFISKINELKDYIYLTENEEKQLRKVTKRHPMLISKFYLSLIDFSDPADPLRKMVIPSSAELNISGSYDTSGESKNTKLSGLQHKYNQTALILSTNRCASYCRFCFRKRMVGLKSKEVIRHFSHAVDYIKTHLEINNVLISGGDPFMLPTEIIRTFIELLAPIEHLQFIRFGTKTPVYYPKRFLEDRSLIEILNKFSQDKLQIYVVTQIDHAREITPELKRVVHMLLRAGAVSYTHLTLPTN